MLVFPLICLLVPAALGAAADLSFPYSLQWKRLVHQAPQGALARGDSLVFIGQAEGCAMAVRRQDGVRLWQRRGYGPVRWLVAAKGGQVVFADSWGGVHKLDQGTGEAAWSFQRLGRGNAELALGDSLVYAQGAEGWLYALDHGKGTLIWQVRTAAGLAARPRLHGRRLYVGTADGRLVVLEAHSGVQVGQVEMGTQAATGALVVGEQVIVAGGDGYVRAYDLESLQLRWQRRLGGKVVGLPLAAKGRLVCAADNGWMYGLRPEDGALLWKQELGALPTGSPVLGPRGEVAVGTEKGRALAVEAAAGEVAWDVQVVEGREVVLHEGGEWLYACAGDHYVYAFALPPALRAEGKVLWEEWWEVRQQGSKTGYRHALAQEVQVEGRRALRLAEEEVEWRGGFRRHLGQALMEEDLRPLSFWRRSIEGSQVVEVEGAWRAESLYLEQRLAGCALRRVQAVAPGVVLPEAVLLRLEREGRLGKAGRDSLRVFDYASLKPGWLRLDFGEAEGGGQEVRWHWAEPLVQEIGARSWLGSDGRPLRGEVPLLGIEERRVKAAQALAWVPPGEDKKVYLDHGVADPLAVDELVVNLPEELGEARRLLVEDERQQIRTDAQGRVQLVMRRVAYEGTEAPGLPIEDQELRPYLESSLYIQADDARVRELAGRLRGEERDSWKVACRLRQWVYDQMRPRDTNVRFKSTLEVLEEMEGTCSEYAALYLALCRAAGIPARACVGFVASATGELVLHIWTQVYVGRWIDVDPSWNEAAVDAAHIKTGQGRLVPEEMRRLNASLNLWLALADTVELVEYRGGGKYFLGEAEKLFARARQAEKGFADAQAQELYHQVALLPWNQRSGQAHVHIARHRLRRSELEDAAWALERVLRQEPQGEEADDALFYLARVAEARGERAVARRQLERLVRDFPDHDLADDALGHLAELSQEEGGCTAAAPYYQRLREEYSRSGWAGVAQGALERCGRHSP
jgi:outer membrane protein assembly factor BamB/tetratricopeptide (TPR) repeat protein